jgi:hypothetical protein
MKQHYCRHRRQTARPVVATLATFAAVVMLAALLALAPAVASAAPAAQARGSADSGEPIPLLLGEMGAIELAAGESVSYVVNAPQDGLYVIASGDEAAAGNFTLVLTHERGNEVYNGVFQTMEIELDDGDHTLTATAGQDGVLSIVMTGQIGDLSPNYGDGDMMNGGFVTQENVESDLYAQLTIAESDYWQRAMIMIQGGDGDSYSASVSGENTFASLDDSSVTDMLTFFTRGSDYDLQITPLSGGSTLTVIPFLSGPLPSVAAGEEVSGEFGENAADAFYQFDVAEAGTLVTVEVASDSADTDIDLAVAIQPGIEPWTSTASGPNERVQFIAPAAGGYIVRLHNYSEGAAAYTLRVDEGEAAPELALNERTWGTVAAGESGFHQFTVNDAGKLLTVYLVGSEDQDLDMTTILVDAEGTQQHYLSASTSGSVEVVSQPNAAAGVYEVRVRNDYSDADANYVLLAQLLGAEDIARQWAVDATASSQYGEDGYSALQATGEPNVLAASDNPAAWASQEADGTTETLELTYEHAVRPARVNIHETYNPGAVSIIEAFNEDAGEWVVLWEGSEPAEEAMRVFSPEFETPDFATTRIRLTLDSDAVGGWNEIDAVELAGRP